jgi:hypothetical protein
VSWKVCGTSDEGVSLNTSNNLDSIVDSTNIIETSRPITREVEITSALKFENCKFEDCNFNVTAGKEK